MKLYHGTNNIYAKLILDQGLRSRREIAKNNEGNVRTHPDAVYMGTRKIAEHCANSRSAKTQGFYPPVIIEIDTTKLCPEKFSPDENFLYLWLAENDRRFKTLEIQAFRTHVSRGLTGGELVFAVFKSLRPVYHQAMFAFSHLADESLAKSGAVAYFGNVPPSACRIVPFVPCL